MSDWRPINTVPQGPFGYYFLRLAWKQGDEWVVADGMRWKDKFFAAVIFYNGGPANFRQYEIREAEVFPSHWKESTETPDDQ